MNGAAGAAAGGAGGGDEEVLPFEEEGTLLREEGFEGAEVHHHIVRLHIAEVRVEGGRELGVGGGAPEQFGANLGFAAVPHPVEAGGGERIVGQLGARFDVTQFVSVKGGKVFVHRAGQGRHGPGLAAETPHLPLEIETHLTDVVGDAGQGHHGPWHEELHAPAVLQGLGAGVP